MSFLVPALIAALGAAVGAGGLLLGVTVGPGERVWIKPNEAAAYSWSNSLDIRVSGVKPLEGGHLAVAVFHEKNAANFPASDDLSAINVAARILVESDNVHLTLHNLSPGRYAIATFHDANGNGKLDVGGFGAPTEGVGFSKNPTIGPGGVAFSQASFEVSATGGQKQAITLLYP